MDFDVAGSAEFIMRHAKDVSIDDEAVARLAERLRSEPTFFKLEDWIAHELNPKTRDDRMLEWIFVVDTLNFSFFAEPGEELFACEYRGKRYTGYWSLCACINRALDEGIAITTPSHYAHMTFEQFVHVFRSASNAPVPLLQRRFEILQEAGQALEEHFEGSVKRLVEASNNHCQQFLKLLCQHFPSYRDYREHEGRTVYFLKRAQILVADIWAAFEGRYFDVDIDSITMFADYRVPQMLLAFGVLKYSAPLLEHLKRGDPVDARQEAEIRGGSIHAVELVRRACDDAKRFNGITIDFYLWDLAKAKGDEIKQHPIHRLRTHFY